MNLYINLQWFFNYVIPLQSNARARVYDTYNKLPYTLNTLEKLAVPWRWEIQGRNM